ncbi:MULTISPECIES: Gfo/Idh/MocA family oxidoreductase [unclassified Tatumella]|uniref:Gfo/Idh/MocA family protein n=1 Tax=unclassified Tatumella TaxID=2649542 RepID=UPI001BAF8B65|nr:MULTISPECIES: Gfo/Idh/MocA family oxidoreductase [unclassified Tatumella]MBS0877767.1 Gfo/Idh/MocA family oxidoreductase [Tatumella sp. JGM82]MBS0891444.1 Gfo/Idh/MocA family oxidoreductase [Tatumella sp. JGM94]MBS0902402.1 Gfo/Idh/MocA family oxidoreductase [Tatumella sp. JGM100]
MLRLAVIGTNWITDSFVTAALESGLYQLTAVYSRRLAQAESFAAKYADTTLFTDLQQLAKSDLFDAVYIASPNSLHCEQSCLFMQQGKHVICEKPFAADIQQAEKMVACAREHQVVLFEAFKTACLPNFRVIYETLPRLGTLRKVLLQYCQYSSRYGRYLAGENPNTFNPAFANGSVMDIGFYPLASAVALWGKPQGVVAQASLLESGVDAHGSVILEYGDFDVTILHSKVSDSVLSSEIQGEQGSLLVDKISTCEGLTLYPRGGQPQAIGVAQYDNSMRNEAEVFAGLVAGLQVEHQGLQVSLITSQLLTEIRRQTGVRFPSDGEA